MKIVPFHVEHLRELEVDERHNRDGRFLLDSATGEMVAALLCDAWSMEHAGRVVACGGRTPVGGWWILFERIAIASPLSFTRRVRAVLRDRAMPGDFAHALDDEAAEWLRVLGFEDDAETFDPCPARRLRWAA